MLWLWTLCLLLHCSCPCLPAIAWGHRGPQRCPLNKPPSAVIEEATLMWHAHAHGPRGLHACTHTYNCTWAAAPVYQSAFCSKMISHTCMVTTFLIWKRSMVGQRTLTSCWDTHPPHNTHTDTQAHGSWTFLLTLNDPSVLLMHSAHLFPCWCSCVTVVGFCCGAEGSIVGWLTVPVCPVTVCCSLCLPHSSSFTLVGLVWQVYNPNCWINHSKEPETSEQIQDG